MKSVFVALLVLCSVVCAAIFALSSRSNQIGAEDGVGARIDSSVAASPGDTATELAARLRALELAYRNQNAAVAALQSLADDLTEQVLELGSTPLDSDERSDGEVGTPLSAEPSLEDDVEREYALVEALELSFQSEELDREWSARAAGEIEELLLEQPDRYRIVSNECRSTFCRVEVDYHAEDNLDALFFGLGWNSDAKLVNARISDDFLRASIYISRDSFPLPSP